MICWICGKETDAVYKTDYDLCGGKTGWRKGGKKDVLHQQTCPVCGRKLVNTYRRGNEWKCRVCWEEADNTAKATH